MHVRWQRQYDAAALGRHILTTLGGRAAEAAPSPAETNRRPIPTVPPAVVAAPAQRGQRRRPATYLRAVLGRAAPDAKICSLCGATFSRAT